MSHKAQLKEKRETFAAHGRAGPPTPCRLRCAQRAPEISDDLPACDCEKPISATESQRHDTNTIRPCHAGTYFLAGDQPVGSTCRAADHNLVCRSGAQGKVEPTYPKRGMLASRAYQVLAYPSMDPLGIFCHIIPQ